MIRCPTLLLLLQLVQGARVAGAFAEESPPASAPDSNSVEVGRNGQDPKFERRDREFLANEGKRIRKILVRDLEVFGPSITDTTVSHGSWATGVLDHLDFQTRESTIRQALLFGEGDVLDPFRLADSERVLRGLAFISDAWIAVEPLPENADSADVRVIVKESWTLQLSARLGESERVKVSLAEKNFLGRGHQVSVAGTRTPDATPKLGFATAYSVQNVSGTFVTATLEYEKLLHTESEGLAFSRDLVSPVFNYAGGLALRRTAIEEEDSLASRADNTSNLVDLWAGRLFHLGQPQKGVLRRRILFLSARIRHVEFTNRPLVTPSTFTQYHDISHYLGSLALIRIRHFRTSLLYDFGRTEDVPHGYLARVSYGLADDEFARKPYGSAAFALGGKLGGLGYGAGSVRIGGYPKNGAIEQGVVRVRTLFFSKLLRAGKWQFRQFVRSDYTGGIHRFPGESIDLNGDESIRGARYDGSVIASERLRFSFENVVFTPWKARGLTFAFFSFADLDALGSAGEKLLAQKFYSGLGLGLRLHKAAYGIGPLELRFAWYPSLPIDHDEYSVSASGEKRFPSIDFLPGSPEIVPY